MSSQDQAVWFPQHGCDSPVGGIEQSVRFIHLANTSTMAKARSDVPTMADNPIPLRVVIQQLGTYPVPNYRVIVYGDELKPMHSDFESAALLLEALRCALPGLDVSQLSLNPLQEKQGSIVFDGEMLLGDEQRSALGLR